MFYDADILEEKAFDEWSSKVSKKYVSKDLSQEIHDRAVPFLTWLKVAEEEESEEEDDDLEASVSLFILYIVLQLFQDRDRTFNDIRVSFLQIEYDDRAKQSLKRQQEPQPVQKPAAGDDCDEDDFDIDAI